MSDAYMNGKSFGFGSGTWGKRSFYITPNQGKVCMRSGWEVKTADYLTLNNVDWYYENEWLDLGNTKYLPDFYLPKLNVYIEVKGRKKGSDIEKVVSARKFGNKVFLWDAEELFKRGIIKNTGITEINRKYRNYVIKPFSIDEL